MYVCNPNANGTQQHNIELERNELEEKLLKNFAIKDR
jgi:hypothetical protein